VRLTDFCAYTLLAYFWGLKRGKKQEKKVLPKVHTSTLAAMEQHANGWDSVAERQVRAWIHIMDLNSATNELAALFYSRVYKLALMLVSVLTVVVGSKGLATVVAGNASKADIAIGVCEIMLGVFATLLSNMELKNKGESFSKRSIGYGKMASCMRIQLVLRPEERDNKSSLLASIPPGVEQLESMAEPLPLRYRREAATMLASRQHSLSVRGGVLASHPPAAEAADPEYHTQDDREGDPTSIISTIILQRV
jgi:hypothetical protein